MRTLRLRRARCVLIAVVLLGRLWVTSSTMAQTFTVLRSFGKLTDVSGTQPDCQLVQGADGTLYGTTSEGYGGSVFRIRPDGSGLTTLKWFTNALDGLNPIAGLALSEQTLYGTTPSGGVSGAGTVFKINTDGTGFAVLKHFAGDSSEGGRPIAALTLSGNDLYGTMSMGGGQSFGLGGVFKLKTDGTGFTVLKEFREDRGDAIFVPRGRLVVDGDVLYGTTSGGLASFHGGGVFKLSTDGTDYGILKQGVNPLAGLTLANGVLYGTTYLGGRSNLGTVFRLNIDGTGFRVLQEFTGGDGAQPLADLVLSSGVLYGTTSSGGRDDGGTVFRVHTEGTSFSVLKEVYTGAPEDGAAPNGGLVLSNGVLYGTTRGGGTDGGGTLFKLSTNGTDYAVIKAFGAILGDAVRPQVALTRSGVQLYGTTTGGGEFGFGTVFRCNTDGTGYEVLKHFAGAPHDGAGPHGDLILTNGVLYGVTWTGGGSNAGTVFKLNADGTSDRILKEFNRSEGGHSVEGLTLSDGVLYGSTRSGGGSNAGALFRLNTDGTGHQVLKEFRGDDGANPIGSLAVSAGVLYGATYYGGGSGRGTVFRVNTDGSNFAVLKQFTGSPSSVALPIAGVIVLEGVIYGTTGGLGGRESGTLFRMNTDGTGFLVLRSFGSASRDGRYPGAVLAAASGVLYGVTLLGGSLEKGTIFKIQTDGTGYAVLRDFQGSDGDSPMGGLTLTEGSLYGTTYSGGTLGLGTLFRLDLSPRISLTARAPDNALVLSWSDPGFSLQSAPAVTAPYTTLQGATSPYTNRIAGSQRFFRLIGN